MVITSSSPLSIGASHSRLNHADGSCCSTSYGLTNNKLIYLSSSHVRLTNTILDPKKFNYWRVFVAADYSDSLPDSSYDTHCHRYHPLEDVKPIKKLQNAQLTPAEIARTTIEANQSALVVFPGSVHCEPHEQISWAEFSYVIDDFGDIFFSIPDGRNILQDPGAANLVNAFVGMDIPFYGNKAIPEHIDVFSMDNSEDMDFNEDYFVAHDSEFPDVPSEWDTPEISSVIHPIHFAKCLTKASSIEHERKANCPSNSVSLMGCLRPAFADEESYIKDQFGTDDVHFEWKEGDDLSPKFSLYRLDIMKIELFSVYGTQTVISLQEFQDGEPDVLARSVQTILDQFSENGPLCSSAALKALCKKRGLYVETATMIGVDSLGIDVRVSCGLEVRTHRFPFKTRAINEVVAEKQIQQLLFPRSRRKKFTNGMKDAKSF